MWTYIQQAGYSVPRNFPSGADTYAPYIVGLFSQLSYVQDVELSFSGGGTQIGLHFIPPVDRNHTRVIQMEGARP